MATIADDEETIEARSLLTSFDPYGQLIKVLVPRAQRIAICDRRSRPLWLSDACDGTVLLQLVEDSLSPSPSHEDGFAHSQDGETTYVFPLREGATQLGAVALSCEDRGGGGRSFAFVQSLLRPALQVIERELANQSQIDGLRKNLSACDSERDTQPNPPAAEPDGDLDKLVHDSAVHLDCAVGALSIPSLRIAISHSTECASRSTDGELLDKTQRHLFAWVQVQQRTLVLNKAPANNPAGALPYKILACPIRDGVQRVSGILVLYRPAAGADFTARDERIIEQLGRRIESAAQSTHDPSTGLLTRAAFEQRALAAIAAADHEAQHCVVYADIDRLHVVNENHGMHVGDDVISRIAATIRRNLDASISAARISGDRFALFFANSTVAATAEFATSLCTTVNKLDFRHDDRRIDLSLSCGLAPVHNAKCPLSHALAAAEVACKAAKDRGRGRVELYNDADRSIVRRYEDVTIVGNLREAILRGRFRMDAQPVVQLRDGAPPRRFELLLRMLDASDNTVMPDKFLSAAERYQLGRDIDRWVVRHVLETLSTDVLGLTRLGAHFAINISGQSLGEDRFGGYLEYKLREYQLPPDLLSFEITETAAVANVGRAEVLIRRLRDLGYAIALDDFGKGLSSLTYLKQLPVSDLKIDGGLVRDLAGNARAPAMVNAIVQLAQAMNLKTTAECVESEAILKTVGQLGVDYGQGFAIGRPRPLEVVLQELLRGDPCRRTSSSAVLA